MKFKVVLPFKAGEVSPRGLLYPSEVLEEALSRFKQRIEEEAVYGGVIKRGELKWEKPTHKVVKAEMATSGQVTFDCEVLDTEDGRDLMRLLTECSIEFLPVMETPRDQPQMIDGVKTITKITNIAGVSIGIKEEKDECE
jgi:hypothetical protein